VVLLVKKLTTATYRFRFNDVRARGRVAPNSGSFAMGLSKAALLKSKTIQSFHPVGAGLPVFYNYLLIPSYPLILRWF
jgi:hypothetical protein